MKLRRKENDELKLIDNFDHETLYSFKVCTVEKPPSLILSDEIKEHIAEAI